MNKELKNNQDKLIVKEYDVIVVGGGLSGVCAAIASARHGMKTALIQNRPVLGGNASSEIRMHICGADNHASRPDSRETGIILEILLENKLRNPNHSFSILDTILWEKTKFQDNLDTYLNTQMDEVVTLDNTIQKVFAYQMTTEKRFCFKGNYFIDATGDGYLGYLSGAEFLYGRECKDFLHELHAPEQSDKHTMGNSLMFRAVKCSSPTPFVKPDWAYTYTDEEMSLREITEVSSGYWWIELGGDDMNVIKDGEIIRDELLKTLYGVWDYVKNSGKFNAENYCLDWIGFLPGKRESRRLVGDYILCEQDLSECHTYDDAVAYGGWPMDVHTIGGMRNTSNEPTTYIYLKDVYQIPYRCLYSRNINNLFLGGRSISVTHMAFASTRVMATCAIVGQAIGTAAFIAGKYHISPREVNHYINELQQTLLRDDCYIPYIKSEDMLDISSKAHISCSSELPEGKCIHVVNGISRKVGDNTNCWISQEISNNGEWIEFDFSQQETISEISLRFDPDLSHQIMPSLSEYHQGTEVIGLPPTLVKDYTISLYNENQIVFSQHVTDNNQRLCNHKFEHKICCDCVQVTVHSTYGDKHARIFEVRIY